MNKPLKLEERRVMLEALGRPRAGQRPSQNMRVIPYVLRTQESEAWDRLVALGFAERARPCGATAVFRVTTRGLLKLGVGRPVDEERVS